ncbi:SMP-30/gluconolactonase/LRE family protein [Shouchella clausii]|uniref:SMP-30/gluconolactonase/LRE family protein n=1 Tax=Shouchella rhizosphaerae TaxID=866786 RepID=A0ABZ2CXH4_9BACI|nr:MULTISPECIES: SMP-30/gluconolactonase/LRE family protein [Shouchella]MCM3313736.1 SMP-30/gluconolactonase/LRE family protein [Psychrobacillus sp. MER TA 17]ALA54274.1 Gluconolactonase [Shouchella clausii]MBU3232611.1 SMP-30/gluconolactonase/LRE family protein [Shouchella clausii]MBU3265989.1 SMP-30/gluconolactonase/LRE family protein [Shouchella clausii]MBU3506111.1 SMP-30/gluconolactonase/LRE family protein [Shouchella clausii]
MIQAEAVWKGKAALGEGPLWDEGEQVLYWVDIDGYKLHRFNPKTNDDQQFSFAQHVSAVVKKAGGGFVLAMGDGLYLYEEERLTPYFLLPQGGKQLRFNDAKCDPAGRLWAGTMAFDCHSPIGALYCLDHNGQISKAISGLAISNGLAWDEEKGLLYHNETASASTTAYRFDEQTGEMSEPRIIDIPYRSYNGSPDGMAIDENGHLWIALYGASKVICVDPDNGNVLEEVVVPATNVTSCAFGGEDYRTLYVTTANKQGEHEGGSLFAARVESAGLPAHAYLSRK